MIDSIVKGHAPEQHLAYGCKSQHALINFESIGFVSCREPTFDGELESLDWIMFVHERHDMWSPRKGPDHLSALGTGAEAGRGPIDVRVARTRPPHQPRGGRRTMTPLVLAAI